MTIPRPIPQPWEMAAGCPPWSMSSFVEGVEAERERVREALLGPFGLTSLQIESVDDMQAKVIELLLGEK